MSGVADAVGGVVGKATDLIGGGSGSTSSNSQTFERQLGGQSRSTSEAGDVASNQLTGLDIGLRNNNGALQSNTNDVDNLFRQALIHFSTGNLQPSADQLNQATQFVDQTFTQPAQTQYGKFLNQAQEAITNRAAAMGRNSTDSAYTQAFAGQANDAAQNLSDQRGSLIAQKAQDLSVNQPLQQLNSLLSGSQYFNNAYNNSISNRLNLLNQSTAQQNLGLQQQQGLGGYTVSGQNYTPGPSLGSQLGGLIGSAGTLGGVVGAAGGLPGIGASIGTGISNFFGGPAKPGNSNQNQNPGASGTAGRRMSPL